MSSITTSVLPILVSLMLFFTGGAFWGADTQTDYQGSYEITVGETVIKGAATATQDGMSLSLTSENETLLAVSLGSKGVTLTIDGETQSIPFTASAITTDSLLQNMGLTQAQSEYLTAGGLASDFTQILPLLENLDTVALLGLKNDDDRMGGSITISSNSLKSELPMFFTSLMTNKEALDTLTSLKAWDVFAPDTTDRANQTILMLRDAAQAISGMKADFTLSAALRVGDDTSVRYTLDVKEDGAEIKQESVLSIGAQRVSYASKLTLADETGKEETPVDMTAVATLKDGCIDTGDLRIQINANKAITVNGKYHKETDAHVLTLDCESKQEDSVTSRFDATLTLQESESKPFSAKLVAVSESVFGDGEAQNVTNITGRLNEKGLMVLIDGGANAGEMTSVSLDWSKENKVEGNLVNTRNNDVSVGTIAIGIEPGESSTSYYTDISATDNGQAVFTSSLKGVMTLSEDKRTLDQKIDLTASAAGEEPFTMTATAQHEKVEKGTAALPTEIPTELPTATEEIAPQPTSSLSDIAQGLLTTSQTAPVQTVAPLRQYEATGVADGFLGKVYATVTCDENGAIIGVVFKTEGEGKGTAIENDTDYAAQFLGRSGQVENSDITDTVSRATWTCYGAVEAVNEALKLIAEQMGK